MQYFGRPTVEDLCAISPTGATSGDSVFGTGDEQVRRQIEAPAYGAGRGAVAKYCAGRLVARA